jgi:hypothetical protein
VKPKVKSANAHIAIFLTRNRPHSAVEKIRNCIFAVSAAVQSHEQPSVALNVAQRLRLLVNINVIDKEGE